MKNIVIVEDNLLIASEIKKSLAKTDFEITHVFESGEDLLAAIPKLNTDLILMDIMLKGRLNGIETVKQFSSIRKIPVIFLTAYSDRDTLRKAEETGNYIYLIKPAGKEELIASIELSLRENNNIEESTKKPSLDYTDNILLITKEGGKVVFINSAAEKLLELPPGNFNANIIDSLLDYLNLINAPDFIKKKNLANAKRKFSHLVEFSRRKSERFEASLKVIPINKVNYDIAGIVFSVKQVKESDNIMVLKKAASDYKAIFDYIEMPSLILDADGKVFLINGYFTKQLGISEKEIITQSWYNYIYPQSAREKVADSYTKYFNTDSEIISKKYSVIPTSGVPVEFQWHTVPIKNNTDSPVGFLLIGEKSLSKKN